MWLNKHILMEYLLKRFLEAKYEYLRIGLGVLEHKGLLFIFLFLFVCGK